MHQVEALTNLTPTTVRLPNLCVVRTNTPLLYSDARVATPPSGGTSDGDVAVEPAEETPKRLEPLGVAADAGGYEGGAAAVTHENMVAAARNVARNRTEGVPTAKTARGKKAWKQKKKRRNKNTKNKRLKKIQNILKR